LKENIQTDFESIEEFAKEDNEAIRNFFLVQFRIAPQNPKTPGKVMLN